jgi:predicted dithiol-disulfide oxidoreductase (DUF899 family)
MKKTKTTVIKDHPVVTYQEWLSARMAFLTKEKKFSRLRDELNRERRSLPWEKVDKQYVFDAPDGRKTLAELFEDKSQLLVYHFMFAPEWDEGCPNCSFWADHYDAAGLHLPHRDAILVVISRAPLEKLEAFKIRMGWRFKWVSSNGNDFNYDYHVSFTSKQIKGGLAVYNYSKMTDEDFDREGFSAFYKDESGAVFHTYSTYARGIDLLNGTYNFLDLAPKGRDEDGLDGALSLRRPDLSVLVGINVFVGVGVDDGSKDGVPVG